MNFLRGARWVSSVWDAFLNFLYPPICVICKTSLVAPEKLVCNNCWQKLQPDGLVQHERISSGEQLEIHSVWEFSDDVQTLIHELKYHGKKSLSEHLGHQMANLIPRANALMAANLLVPVPLHRARLRERGFNQSLLLCQAISCHSGIPVEPGTLKRSKSTKTQAKLSAAERVQNVATAFRITDTSRIAGKRIVLVDDVLTTGATLRACAGVLRQGGATSVVGLTAARTPL